MSVKRPEIFTDEHMSYLDNLRDSGVTNMYGSGSYVRGRFGLSRADAQTIVLYWMESYEEMHPL